MATRAELLAACDAFLSEVAALLSRMPTPDERLDQKLVLAISVRVLKLAHHAHTLCVADSASDAEPLARAMLSGTVSLVFLLDYDTGRRSALYLAAGSRASATRWKRLVGLGMMAPKDATAREKRDREQLEQTLTSHGLDKVNRNRYDNRNTWHGLSERLAFDLMGWVDWYEMYSEFSESIHVGPGSLNSAVEELHAESIHLDKSGGDPYLVMLTINLAVGQCMVKLDTLFGWKQRDGIEAMGMRFARVVSAYAKANKAASASGPAGPISM